MKKTETDFQQTRNNQEEVSRKRWSTEYPLITLMLFHLIGKIRHIVYPHFADGVVVRGATLGSTNQKAGFRSRGTNGPISVQQEVM